MLHPSYTDLMEVVNSDVEPGEQPIVQSRYSIVLATAKRARQLIAGDEPLVKVKLISHYQLLLRSFTNPRLRLSVKIIMTKNK